MHVMHAGTIHKLIKNACHSTILVVVAIQIVTFHWNNVKNNVRRKFVSFYFSELSFINFF